MKKIRENEIKYNMGILIILIERDKMTKCKTLCIVDFIILRDFQEIK